MKRFLKWAVVAAGAMVLVVIGLYGLSRALGPSDRHERALALMSEREPVTGTNAFAALWRERRVDAMEIAAGRP